MGSIWVLVQTFYRHFGAAQGKYFMAGPDGSSYRFTNRDRAADLLKKDE
jgi:hypothetical protein